MNVFHLFVSTSIWVFSQLSDVKESFNLFLDFTEGIDPCLAIYLMCSQEERKSEASYHLANVPL